MKRIRTNHKKTSEHAETNKHLNSKTKGNKQVKPQNDKPIKQTKTDRK